jgi:hypothetical protein
VDAFKDPFERLDYMDDKPSRDLLEAYTRLVTTYMDRVHKLCPRLEDSNDISQSQHTLADALTDRVERALKPYVMDPTKVWDLPFLEWDRVDSALGLPFLELVKHLLKTPMGPILRSAEVGELYKKLVTCLARSIALITDYNTRSNAETKTKMVGTL